MGNSSGLFALDYKIYQPAILSVRFWVILA